MYIKCVACLTTKDTEHFPLSAVLPDYFEINLTVLELLEVVTSTSVCKYVSPNSICSGCLKKLKECYIFIREFKISQLWLEENLTQEAEEDIGKDNLEEIILKVECEDEKEPELDTEMVKIASTPQYTISVIDASKIVDKTPVQKQILIDHSYPIVPKKLRLIKPKDELVMSAVDASDLTRKSKKVILPRAKIKKDEIKNEKSKELEPNSIVMSVIDVLNAKSERKISSRVQPKSNKIITGKVRAKNKEEEEEPIVCDICNNIYPNQKSLKNHKRRVHVSDWEEKLICNVCGLQCKTRSSYTHHRRKHRAGEGGQQIKCDNCDKVCSTIGQLKYHKMIAHGPEDYLCNHCGERFHYARALTFHEVTVHQIGDKPFMCRYCGFRCLQRGHLKRHERCHTDERPYKCKFKYCDKTFRGKSEMHAHHRVHEGNKTLECKYCGKMFYRLWNMKLHWLQHKGNYKCTLCTKSFAEKQVLNFHYFHRHKVRKQSEEKDESEYVEENDETEYVEENDESEYVDGNDESEYVEENNESEYMEIQDKSEYLQDDLHGNLDLEFIMQSDEGKSD